MANFPVHPFHINGFISKVRAKTHQQQDISAELELIIEGAKATLHEINEQCEDDICRTAAKYATDAETAFSALMLALNHYPGGQFAEVMVVAYRLKEGYFQELQLQLDAIDVLSGKIHTAAAAITWNLATGGRKLETVKQDFHSTQGLRHEKKQTIALTKLGITAGKRRATYDKKQLFLEYMNLLDSGHDKWEAIKIITKNHEIASAEATLQLLRRHVREQKKILQAATKSTDHLKKILPGNPQ